PRLVGGTTPAATNRAAALLEKINDHVLRLTSPDAAELAKLVENVFRNVNIALVNQLALLCERMNLDVWEVIDAAATKPFGFMPFYPGPGVGGHCIPVDPSYLQWKMRNLEYRTRFIDLGDDVNRGMPAYVVQRAADILNDVGRSVRGSRILLIGVAYKPNVGDVRESPGVEVAQKLIERGADVRYADPHVPSLRLHDGTPMTAVPLTASEVDAADLVVITTRHDAVDWGLVCVRASLVLDTRGVHAGRGHPGWHTL
ncbi:MAG: nucleotide sugar dehydrogenase, partial [Candidatus Dormibacteraeota bacterium]|nr:nucleotide sugar dehydrogenase [Candidatus Dormibacteraeota bacterium]